jgi:hypothetical protein
VRYDRPAARTVFLLLLAFLVAETCLDGFEPALGRRLIDEAVDIGQTRIEAVRERFHEPYRLDIAAPPIDYVDLVTPFRRVVLLAEERARAGARLLLGEAGALLADRLTLVELRVEMTFHPLNTFVDVPSYDILLVTEAAGVPIDPVRIELIPRFGARLAGVPSGLPSTGAIGFAGESQPLLGGAIVATFDSDVLARTGVYEVILSESGRVLAQTRLDLGTVH